eukprot:PhM_4_TR11021/c0_g1_i1/m.84299
MPPALQFKKQSKAVVFCTKCGAEGHTHTTCPADKVCYKCKAKGHVGRDCKEVIPDAPRNPLHSAREQREFARYYDKKGTTSKNTNNNNSVMKRPREAEDEHKHEHDPMANPVLAVGVEAVVSESPAAASSSSSSSLLFTPPSDATVPSTKYYLRDDATDTDYALYNADDMDASATHYVLGKHNAFVQHVRSHPTVSRMHLAVVHRRTVTDENKDNEDNDDDDDVGVYIVDLNSTGGTTLNGNKITPMVLTAVHVDDVIKMAHDNPLTLLKKGRWEE